MVQELPRRTNFSGPALIRLLARLSNTDVLESGQSIADRLGLWLGWTDAIALAGVLNGPALAVPSETGSADKAVEAECARERAALQEAIIGVNRPVSARHRGQRAVAVQRDVRIPAPVEFATYRRRYSLLQERMATSITGLRSRLRTALACRDAKMIRLVGVDAAMEQALSPREDALLAGVPALLEGHFQRLQQAAQIAPADGDHVPQQSAAQVPNAWLDIFEKDMQSVLLAELDIRLQALEGLLAALQDCQPRTL